jgi:hypothetical protein
MHARLQTLAEADAAAEAAYVYRAYRQAEPVG